MCVGSFDCKRRQATGTTSKQAHSNVQDSSSTKRNRLPNQLRERVNSSFRPPYQFRTCLRLKNTCFQHPRYKIRNTRLQTSQSFNKRPRRPCHITTRSPQGSQVRKRRKCGNKVSSCQQHISRNYWSLQRSPTQQGPSHYHTHHILHQSRKHTTNSSLLSTNTKPRFQQGRTHTNKPTNRQHIQHNSTNQLTSKQQNSHSSRKQKRRQPT